MATYDVTLRGGAVVRVKFDTIHVQKVGEILRTHCGRRIGTPRGRIYPGVRACLPSDLEGHPHPDVVRDGICRSCLKVSGIKLGT